MRFEKVSFEQFFKDYQSLKPDSEAWYVEEWLENLRFNPQWVEENIYNKIKIPARATVGSAGYDFFAPFDFGLRAPYSFDDTYIRRDSSIKFPTGIRIVLDDDKYLAIYPRSGLGFKYKVQLFNTVGIIDRDYYYSDNEGHIWVKLYNDSPEGKRLAIKQGEAFCQGIIQQYFLTEDDEANGIRNGGLGSTGA